MLAMNVTYLSSQNLIEIHLLYNEVEGYNLTTASEVVKLENSQNIKKY